MRISKGHYAINLSLIEARIDRSHNKPAPCLAYLHTPSDVLPLLDRRKGDAPSLRRHPAHLPREILQLLLLGRLRVGGLGQFISFFIPPYGNDKLLNNQKIKIYQFHFSVPNQLLFLLLFSILELRIIKSP